MRRQRGQIMIIFIALLPVLIGFLGLALDGAYYFAAGRAATFAASAAARAAAGSVFSARYTTASTSGQAIGQANLGNLQLTGIGIVIEYNNTVNAAPDAPSWYTTTPSTSTRTVRATASGRYTTLFLRIVGVSTVDIQRVAAVSFTGYTPTVMMPIGICRAAMDALDTNPTVPVTLWQFNASLCGVNKWDGLVSIGGATGCSAYNAWILPQPSAPPPAIGSTVALNTQNCQSTDDWIAGSSYYNSNPVQPVLVIDLVPGTTTGQVFCYRQLRLIVGNNTIQALPSATSSQCAKDFYNT